MAKQQLKKSKVGSKVIRRKMREDSQDFGDRYVINDKYVEPSVLNKDTVHTVKDLIKLLETDKTIGIDAITLCYNPDKKSYGMRRLKKDQFLEAFKDRNANAKLKESFNGDGGITQGFTGGAVGSDFIPLLGGNFYKNLYYYDYISMTNLCFWAAHHDPIGRGYVNLMRDFTLGRGFSVNSDNDEAMAIWKAFEEVNDVQGMMESVAREIAAYGETMFWWLPDNQTKIYQAPAPGQQVDKGFIPRIRLIDPSVIWEIVTWPEDITKVLYYVWVAPTAYQVYTGMDGDKGTPSSKFIFQTIPHDQIMHFKVNAFTGEKRGRSDMFPALGFMKRLRDSVDYSLVAQIKQAAYSEDVTINGNQDDVDAYVSAQQAEGTQPQSGSSFVHTEAVKREYLSPATSGSKGSSTSFEWALSMASMALGIPISYWGSHLSGGQTRASAVVGTEPVSKKFEMRQRVYENMIRSMWNRVMDWAHIEGAEMNVTFPEIIAQDRSAKLKDLALCESQKWISEKRAASIAAKELGIEDYDYEKEQEEINTQVVEPPAIDTNPLTGDPTVSKEEPGSQVTSDEKKDIKTNDRS